jgi:hypothetical protein
MAMERQLLTLREAYIGLQARLEDTQQELVQTQQSVAPLLQEAKDAEEGRQDALVALRRAERSLDTETVRSLRRREERECVKREKALLQSENQLLREAIEGLETQQGPSFEDGYFTACYEVATALPPPFDLEAALNWDREQIMTRAAQLAGGDQEAEAPPQEKAHPGQEAVVAAGVQQDGTEGTDLDPPAIEEQVVDPESATGEVIVEDDEGPARSEVPVVEGTQTGSSAVIEVVHNDAAADPMGEGAAGQGEHPEEETEN